MEPIKQVTEPDEGPGISLSQIIGIITRGRWLILAAMCVCTVAATVGAYFLPNRFTSEATLLVVQQQVPERYVTPTSTLGLSDALQAMTQEVLSRKRLFELIEQFGLYAKERRRLAPEQVIGLMRKYINIEPIATSARNNGADFNAFKISFSAEKGVIAQEVTSQLTSLFIQENLKVRGEQAATTTNFLIEHVDAAKKKLAQQEERLKEFKMQHLGELPEQQGSNLGILGSAQTELQNSTASLDRAQQQRVYLQSLLEAYQRLAVQRQEEQRALLASNATSSRLSSGPAYTPRVNDPIETLESDIAQLEASRAKLLHTLREQHPDVLAVDQEIAAKRALIKGFKTAKPAAAKSPVGSSIAQASGPNNQEAPTAAKDSHVSSIGPEDASIAQVKSQLESNRLEIENLSNDQKQVRAAIAQYQSRLNMTPVREEELAGILRDYDLSKKEYEDLLGKEQQSQLATSLEKRQGGQQFRIAEPPSLPFLPSSPNRPKIAMGGAAGGFALGLVLAVLMEFISPKLYSDKEVSRRFSVPLVVALPLLLTPAETRGRSWRKVFEWSAGSVMMIGIIAAECYVYLHP